MADFDIFTETLIDGSRRSILRRYTGPGGDVVIPDGVCEIGYSAFSGCSLVTSVRMPDTVEVIKNRAFEECTQLQRLRIPDAVREIGFWCFSGCKALEEVVLPADLEEVDLMAFSGCGKLRNFQLTPKPESSFRTIDGMVYDRWGETLILCPTGQPGVVTVPDGVRAIGARAFHGCDDLTGVILPDSLETIGESAFDYCPRLREVTLPCSVRTVGSQAFGNCFGLQKLTVQDPHTQLHKHILRESCAALLLPEGYDTDTLPKELKKPFFLGLVMAWEAGRQPEPAVEKALVIYLKSQRKKLYADVGQHPWLLRRMTALQIIPEQEIDDLVARVQKREDHEAAALLLDYRSRVFSPLDRMAREDRELDYELQLLAGGDVPVHWLRQHWNYKKNTDGTLGVTGWKGNGKTAFLPGKIGKNTVTAIHPYAFSPQSAHCSNKKARVDLEQVVLPEGITGIGACAFYDCNSLREITLPQSVTEIGHNAFSICMELQKIALPQGITCIPHMAFRQCRALREITLPAGLESIGTLAFNACISLKELVLPEGLREINAVAFVNCFDLEQIHIPASVEKIAGNAFQGCDKLTIHAPRGSFAAAYAKEKHIPYIEL